MSPNVKVVVDLNILDIFVWATAGMQTKIFMASIVECYYYMSY